MSSTSPAPCPPRTVPTKLQTAPTRWSASRRRASSVLTSKSSCWMATRGTGTSAPRHRWEECDFTALAQRRIVGGHDLVERHADRLARRERLRIRLARRDQFGAQRAERGGSGFALLGAAPDGLAH